MPGASDATGDGRKVSPEYIDIALEKIGESYARFPLIRPRNDSSMLTSIRRVGQPTPVVVGGEDNEGRHEMIDGFKRLRALRCLNGETIRARMLDRWTQLEDV